MTSHEVAHEVAYENYIMYEVLRSAPECHEVDERDMKKLAAMLTIARFLLEFYCTTHQVLYSTHN